MAASSKIIIKGENNIGPAIKSAQKDISSLEKTVTNFNSVMKKAFTVTAIIAAVNKIKDAVSDLAKEYLEIEQTYTRLNAATTINGQSLDKLTSTVNKFSKQTLESKDSIRNLVSQMASMGKSSAEIDKLTEASNALAKVTGKSLQESFNQILGTLSGELGDLKKLGIEFQNLTSDQLKNGKAVDVLISKYGELSKKMSESSFAQDWKDVGDVFDSIKQTSGKVILQFAEDSGFTNLVETTLTAINDWVEKIYLRQIGVYDSIQDAISSNLDVEMKPTMSTIDRNKARTFNAETMATAMGLFNQYYKEDVVKQWLDASSRYGGTDKIPQNVKDYILQPFVDEVVKPLSESANGLLKVITENKKQRSNASDDWFIAQDYNARATAYLNEGFQDLDSLTSTYEHALKRQKELTSVMSKADTNTKEYWDAYSELYKYAPQLEGKYYFNSDFERTAYNPFRGVAGIVEDIESTISDINNKIVTNKQVPYSSTDRELLSLTLERAADKIARKLNPQDTETKNPKRQNLGSSFYAATYGEGAYEGNASSLTYTKGKVLPSIGSDSSFYHNLNKNLLTPNLPKNTVLTPASLALEYGQFSSKYQEYRKAIDEAIRQDKEATENAIRNALPNLDKYLEESLLGDEKIRDILYELNSSINQGKDWSVFKTILGAASPLDFIGSKDVSMLNEMFGLLDSSMSGLLDVLGPITDILMSSDPLITAMFIILQDFVDTLLPAIGAVIQPLLDMFRLIGKSLAETLYPILEALYPWISMITNVLANILFPVIQVVASVMQAISSILYILQPVLQIICDAFTAIAIVLNYVASLFEFVGDVIVTFGKNVGIALYNILHPFSQKDYERTSKSYKSFNEAADEVLSRNENAYFSSIDLSTQGQQAVQNASYTGMGTLTINIYVEAPVVGDGGMEQFARMIRSEFEALDYYST